MSLKMSFAGEGRIAVGFDSRLIPKLIERAYYRVYAGSRNLFTLVHDLLHLAMAKLFRLDRFDPYAAEISNGEYRMKAVVFSERLRVRFLRLAERIKASVAVIRKALLRHQDRGGGDAVSDNDNLGGIISFLRLRHFAQRL